MNDVVFVKGEGGLARTLTGKDHYAGLIFYSTTKPSSWGDNDTREITSLAAAEALGIESDSVTALIQAMHYHLKCFFAVYSYLGVSPKLWLTIADEPATTYDFAEITTTQDFAGGEIRTMGIFLAEALTTTLISAINTVAVACGAAHKPLSCIVTFDDSAVTDWTAAEDLRALSASKVSVSIGQDGGGDGNTLYDGGSLGFSLGNVGSVLAWASSKSVHVNIGWPAQIKPAHSGEFDVPALSNGDLISENEALVDGLNTKGYILLRKIIGLSGSYFNDDHSCIVATSDYAYLASNQVIDKAIRGVYASIISHLNRPLEVDADTGKLDLATVGFFQNLGGKALAEMANAGELSGYGVFVDPEQDVNSTSTLTVNIQMVPIGVARTITVNIGFTLTV